MKSSMHPPESMANTFSHDRDEISHSTEQFIMNLVENGGNIPRQFRTDDVSVIGVPEVHVLEGVIGLQKLKMIAMVSTASRTEYTSYAHPSAVPL
jgi:hypothetical protein